MPPTTRTPKHIQQLAKLEGVGRGKRKLLATKFGTEALFQGATVEELAAVAGIGPKIAKVVHDFKETGQMPESKWRGQKRAIMWDTRRQKKIAGVTAPPDNEQATVAWLAKREAGKFERYTGQDEKQEDPLHVPEISRMSPSAYEAYCSMPADDESRNRLHAGLAKFGLKQQQPAAAQLRNDAVAAPGMARQPSSTAAAPPSLMRALVASAQQLGADSSQEMLLNEWHDMFGVEQANLFLQAGPLPPAAVVLKALHSAHVVFQRPVWLWTGAEGAQVVLVLNDEELNATSVTPLRLAQHGASFAPVGLVDDVDELGASEVEVVEEEEVIEVDEDLNSLQDLKEELKGGLHQMLAQIGEIVGWSKKEFEEPLDLSRYIVECQELLDRLESSDGLYAALLGGNGIGKSTLISLLVFLSRVDGSTYAEHAKMTGYVLEALSEFEWSTPKPTLHTLLASGGGLGGSSSSADELPPVHVEVLSCEPDTASMWAEEHRKQLGELKQHVLGERAARPTIKNVVLPCGKDVKTTSVNTSVRYAKIMHILLTMHTHSELQETAFEFVKLRKDLGNDEADELEDKAKDALLWKWHQYIQITQGIVKKNDLPDGLDDDTFPEEDDLPTRAEDVKVFPQLEELVRNPNVVYVCGGESDGSLLLQHQRLVHDKMFELNDPESLYRVAIKTLTDYQPSAILENGNGFVDCPGLNDSDEACTQQTYKAVGEAGVLLIPLAKSLNEDKSTKVVLKERGAARALQVERPLKVVFVFSREMRQEHSPDKIGSVQELESVATLERETREAWHKILTSENKRSKEGTRTDEAVRSIADNTEMRAIYPMAHTSITLNWQHSAAHPDDAQRIKTHSNVPWLLGLVDALNRDALVDALRRLATQVLPELRDELQGSIDDALDSQVPERLVKVASNLLKTSKKRGDNLFTNVLDELAKNVESLASAGTSTGISIRAKIVEKSAHAFFGDEVGPVEGMLKQAEAGQGARFTQLKTKLKLTATALSAVHPKFMGVYQGGQIVPLVLGSTHGQVNVDFSPLVETLRDELVAFKEAVVDLVIEAVDKLIDASGAQGSGSAAQLKDTFVDKKVLQLLEQRCKDKFFSHKQHHASLARTDVAAHFKRLATTACFVAVKQTILSRHKQCTNAASVHALISDNLAEAREAWKEQTQTQLQDFLSKQFGLLLWDVVGWQKKKEGLLKVLLVAFLQHVESVAAMQKDTTVRAKAQRYVQTVRASTNALHSVWTRSIKQNDPATYGKAAMCHFERAMFQQQTAGAVRPPRPTLSMQTFEVVLLQPHCGLVERGYGQQQHMFSSGEVSQLRALSEKAQAEPLSLFKGKISGYSDLFLAVAVLLYKKRTILEIVPRPQTSELSKSDWFRNHALPAVAKQLRALTVADMAHYYRKEERCAEFAAIAGESAHYYLDRLETKSYAGDVHCLWFIAQSLKAHFRVWLPGTGSALVVTSSKPGHQLNRVQAYNLMLTADETMVQPKAASYEPQFYPMIDARGVRMSGTNEQEVEVSTDDEHTEARRGPKGWVKASNDELDHCPEAIAAYQERQNATARLAQVLPPTPRDVVLGRV